MKNLLIVLLSVTFSIASFAQDADKMRKDAEKAISKLSSDPAGNSAEILSAIANLKTAFEDDNVKSNAKNWVSAGKALNKLTNEEFKAKTLDPNYQLAAPTSAVDAFNMFKGAAALGDKKRAKDIGYGLEESENHLNNYAIFAYQAQDFKKAYNNFSASVEAYDLLKSMGKESRLEADGLLMDQYFFTAVSAYYDNQIDVAKPYLMKLSEMGSTEAFVYEGLYKVYAESDEEKALAYLSQGREMAPDDTGLLFAEINHYLKKGELDILIGKLKTAIEKEPDNVSIYTTLGSVYDQLNQKEMEAGNKEKAAEYFDEAKSYYEQVLAKEPTNFDAKYSIGALYYNKAATYVEKLNTLAADLTPAGMKAYDDTKADMDGLFSEALPYFQEAEKLNGEDRNTIIALKEIHARLNDIESSNKYKAKLEAMGVSNN